MNPKWYSVNEILKKGYIRILHAPAQLLQKVQTQLLVVWNSPVRMHTLSHQEFVHKLFEWLKLIRSERRSTLTLLKCMQDLKVQTLVHDCTEEFFSGVPEKSLQIDGLRSNLLGTSSPLHPGEKMEEH